MSKAEDAARERARRVSAARTRTPEPTAVLEPTPAARVKPIRTTLDLAPALYGDFEDWTINAGRKIGAKINRTDVLRVLVRRLVDDPVFAADVLQRLREDVRR